MRGFLVIALLAFTIPFATGEEPAAALTMADCADCHEDEAASFAASAHGGLMPSETLQVSCVACHGPATDHVEDPDSSNITREPGSDSCQSCHGTVESRLSLQTPRHARAGIGCLDCHATGHSPGHREGLLRLESSELCGECHQAETTAMTLPFAHRSGSRPFACTDCHGLHSGAPGTSTLALGRSGSCGDCHLEQVGPHVYEHDAQRIDGCVTCHTPHGSTNRRMLVRSRPLELCLECHSDVPAFHDLSRARYQDCTSCHFAIHGSSRDPNLIQD